MKELKQTLTDDQWYKFMLGLKAGLTLGEPGVGNSVIGGTTTKPISTTNSKYDGINANCTGGELVEYVDDDGDEMYNARFAPSFNSPHKFHGFITRFDYDIKALANADKTYRNIKVHISGYNGNGQNDGTYTIRVNTETPGSIYVSVRLTNDFPAELIGSKRVPLFDIEMLLKKEYIDSVGYFLLKVVGDGLDEDGTVIIRSRIASNGRKENYKVYPLSNINGVFAPKLISLKQLQFGTTDKQTVVQALPGLSAYGSDLIGRIYFGWRGRRYYTTGFESILRQRADFRGTIFTYSADTINTASPVNELYLQAYVSSYRNTEINQVRVLDLFDKYSDEYSLMYKDLSGKAVRVIRELNRENANISIDYTVEDYTQSKYNTKLVKIHVKSDILFLSAEIEVQAEATDGDVWINMYGTAANTIIKLDGLKESGKLVKGSLIDYELVDTWKKPGNEEVPQIYDSTQIALDNQSPLLEIEGEIYSDTEQDILIYPIGGDSQNVLPIRIHLLPGKNKIKTQFRAFNISGAPLNTNASIVIKSENNITVAEGFEYKTSNLTSIGESITSIGGIKQYGGGTDTQKVYGTYLYTPINDPVYFQEPSTQFMIDNLGLSDIHDIELVQAPKRSDEDIIEDIFIVDEHSVEVTQAPKVDETETTDYIRIVDTSDTEVILAPQQYDNNSIDVIEIEDVHDVEVKVAPQSYENESVDNIEMVDESYIDIERSPVTVEDEYIDSISLADEYYIDAVTPPKVIYSDYIEEINILEIVKNDIDAKPTGTENTVDNANIEDIIEVEVQ